MVNRVSSSSDEMEVEAQPKPNWFLPVYSLGDDDTDASPKKKAKKNKKKKLKLKLGTTIPEATSKYVALP